MVRYKGDKDHKFVYCDDGVIRINTKFCTIDYSMDREAHILDYLYLNKITDENIIQDIYDGKVNIYIDNG
jgi:hypothetical protein